MEDKLKTAVEKIKLLSMKNEEFRNAMKEVFGKKTCEETIVHVVEHTDEEIASEDEASQGREKIDHIYEYCIEEVLKSQAEDFYKDFPDELQPIVGQLITDYIRMESFRRKDNFGDFCVALYQQIEGITNKLCETRALNDIAEKMWGYPTYVEVLEDNNKAIDISRRKGTYAIASLIFLKGKESKASQSLQTLYALDKIRSVIYFVGYNAKMRVSDYDDYVEMCDLMSDIYNCRNTNHRGSTQREYEEEVTTRIWAMRSFYYFKFMGALAQFIDFVKNGIKGLHEVATYAATLEKKPLPASSNIKVVGKIDLPDKARNRFKRIKS